MFSGKHLEVFYSLFEEFFLCLHVLLNELPLVSRMFYMRKLTFYMDL
jgi:hypothetical protein